jgi:hypothetical protein
MASESSSRRNGRAVLIFVAIAPLVLMVVVTFLALQTQNAGEARTCMVNVETGGTVTMVAQPMTVSGVPYEDYTFDYRTQPDSDPVQIMQMGVSRPTDSVNCADNIGSADTVVWVWNDKGMAISPDAGENWYTWEVCNEPRPAFGCTVPEHIDGATFEASGAGSVHVYAPEGSYEVITDDGGATWQIDGP